MAGSPHVLMLFLDGVGIGEKNPDRNPFFSVSLSTLGGLLGGAMMHKGDAYRASSLMSLVPLNATLRVAGLPQSGTGQAALIAGINAPRMVGRHFGPYLYSSLKPVVAEKNIFKTLSGNNKKVFYANAFPQQYFDFLNTRKNRTPAIAFSWMTTGKPLNDAHQLMLGNALSADITNERWNSLGFPNVPVISPEEGGKRLVELTGKFDFVLYEYYLTDHAGHSQSLREASEVLLTLDGLLKGILDNFDPRTMLLVVTSDHGNLEDLSVKTHTRNPVPLLAVGKRHNDVTKHAKNLTQVTSAIMKILQ